MNATLLGMKKLGYILGCVVLLIGRKKPKKKSVKVDLRMTGIIFSLIFSIKFCSSSSKFQDPFHKLLEKVIDASLWLIRPIKWSCDFLFSKNKKGEKCKAKEKGLLGFCYLLVMHCILGLFGIRSEQIQVLQLTFIFEKQTDGSC